MKFLSVGTSKIKVMLSPEECAERGIVAESAEASDCKVRAALPQILELAGRECGFSAENERLLIQLYPAGGGCELFITKLSAMGERERRAVSQAQELTTYQGRAAFFAFASATELLAAARSLAADIPCSIYRTDDGEYFISLREQTVDGMSDVDVLSEYGRRVASLPLGLGTEWGSLLAEGDGIARLKLALAVASGE